jgi:nitroreductase
VNILDIFEILKNRRSIRKYTNKAVEKKKVNQILELASLSPSAMNRQPYAFVVISKNSIIQEISSACNQEWDAPVIIAVCSIPEQAWERDDGEEYWKVDSAIVMNNISMVAYSLGLGTCWIAAFQEEKIKKILQISPKVRVLSLTPLGYPNEKKGPVKKRKSLAELVHYEKW